MTVCNDCGDTLVEVWHDVYVCPDCFFAALTIRHRRGSGNGVGGLAGFANKPTPIPTNPAGSNVGTAAANAVSDRGTGRESGEPTAVGSASRPGGKTEGPVSPSSAAKFLCPSCHQKKEWPFDKVVVPVSEDGLLSPRTFVVCNECWQKAKQ